MRRLARAVSPAPHNEACQRACHNQTAPTLANNNHPYLKRVHPRTSSRWEATRRGQPNDARAIHQQHGYVLFRIQRVSNGGRQQSKHSKPTKLPQNSATRSVAYIAAIRVSPSPPRTPDTSPPRRCPPPSTSKTGRRNPPARHGCRTPSTYISRRDERQNEQKSEKQTVIATDARETGCPNPRTVSLANSDGPRCCRYTS